MKRKYKGLLRLLLFIIPVLLLIGLFFIWDASTQRPLATGDRLMLSSEQPGDLATIGVTLYNNGQHPIRLQGVHVEGRAWQLSAAQITTGLSYTNQPLSTWATESGATLTPINDYRMEKHSRATLGLSLKRTHTPSEERSHLVITYRLWFFTRELRIALD